MIDYSVKCGSDFLHDQLEEEDLIELLESLQERADRTIDPQYRHTGRVISRNASGANVSLNDGSILRISEKNIFTNGEIRNREVVVVYPLGGDPMLLSEVRG